jgi:tetratricopeptide (TPR) repeat protein
MKGVERFEKVARDEETFRLLRDDAAAESPQGLATLYYECMRAVREEDPNIVRDVAKTVEGCLPEDLVAQSVGATLYDTGAHDEGLRLMRKAVCLNPNIQNMVNLASRLNTEDSAAREEALSLYRATLDRAPENEDALLGLGVSLMDAGEMDEAEKLFETVLRLYPETGYEVYAICNLAELLTREGDYAAAAKQYCLAIEKEPSNLHVPYAGLAFCMKELCYVLFSLSRQCAEQSLALGQKALRLKNDDDYAKELLQGVSTFRDYMTRCPDIDPGEPAKKIIRAMQKEADTGNGVLHALLASLTDSGWQATIKEGKGKGKGDSLL